MLRKAPKSLNISARDLPAIKPYKLPRWHPIITDPSLVFAWLGEPATKVMDLSGKNNHGTITSATWTAAGRWGSALSFDGIAGFVSVADATNLRLPNPALTISIWINRTSNDADYEGIVNKWYQTGGYFGFLVQSNSDGKIYFVMGNGGNYQNRNIAINNNVWNHIVAIYDGTNMILYLNGLAGTPVAFSSATSATTAMLICKRIAGVTGYFNGLIDEILIFNRALSASEIKLLYELGKVR